MNNALIASIIGAVATILAPITALAFKSWFEHRDLVRVTGRRRTALEGRWVGNLTYERSAVHEREHQPIEVSFTMKGKIIRGELEYSYEDTREKVVLGFKGGFYDDRFLKCDYRNKDPKMVQFGTILFKLSADASRLTGLLQGFGRHSEDLISAAVDLEKSS